MSENKVVTIDLARFEDLLRAEITLQYLADVFKKQGENFTALETARMILGMEEKKNETV